MKEEKQIRVVKADRKDKANSHELCYKVFVEVKKSPVAERAGY